MKKSLSYTQRSPKSGRTTTDAKSHEPAPQAVLTYESPTGLTEEAAPSPLTESLFMHMHHILGNATLARAVAQERKTFRSSEFAGDAKLEAVLNDEDRLRSGDSGDPVVKVQEALIRDGIPLPQFGADGQYGNETSNAVKEFKAKYDLGFLAYGDVGPGTMDKLDELNADDGGGGGGTEGDDGYGDSIDDWLVSDDWGFDEDDGDGGDVVPPTTIEPDPNDVNPSLETEMDMIGMEYLHVLRQQDKALVTLERDLRNQEEADTTSPLISLLNMAANKVVEQLLPPGSGVLYQAVLQAFTLKPSAYSSSGQSIINKGIDEIFKAVNDKAVEVVNEELSGQQGLEGGSLELFIDSQREAMFDANESAENALTAHTKPQLRIWQPEDERFRENAGTDMDPRVTRALELRMSVRDTVNNAYQEQYFRSLKEWAAYQAQLTLGTETTLDPATGRDKQGTDFDKLRVEDPGETEIRGILEVTIPDVEPENAQTPTRPDELHISGLSAEVRSKINEENQDKTIGELSFPRRVMDGDGIWDDAEVKVGRNEYGGETYDLGSDDDGRAWLEQKGGSEYMGMVILMNEIDQTKVADVEGGLQGPA